METDADTSSKILFFLEQFWSFVAVSLGVALGGVAAKRVVAVLVPMDRQVEAAESKAGTHRSSAADIVVNRNLPLWYRLWRASISFHPVLVGGLCGFAPIPVANWVPDGAAAHVLWFALAGALSGQVFEILKRASEVIPALIRQRLGVAPTPAPAPALAEELEPEDKGALPPKE